MLFDTAFSSTLPNHGPLSRQDGLVGGSAVFWGLKRGFDLVLSSLLLPVLVLLVLIVMILNPVFNRGPLLYKQKRMGRDLSCFEAYKLRTMEPAVSPMRQANDPLERDRITPLGGILRRTRLDELPQILNVLTGHMSLIGPRPDFYQHAEEFMRAIPRYRDRYLVRPGISGLSQVTLGYAEGIECAKAKAKADRAYIRKAGFGLETRIFWLTLVTIFSQRGV